METRKMTPTEINIAIAKVCGWTSCGITDEGSAIGRPSNDPKGYILREEVPDYFNDLNAVHEAEKVLTGLNINRYTDVLVDITRQQWVINAGYEWRIAHATSAQRCEALLRTLNLWRESNGGREE